MDFPQGSLEIVLSEARSWLGTPWHHSARLKGHGVDCVNFLAAIVEPVGVNIEVPRFYGRTPDSDEILVGMREFCTELPLDTPLREGLFLAFRYVGVVHHVAMATSENTIIHASLLDKRVVEEPIGYRDCKRLSNVFDLGLQ